MGQRAGGKHQRIECRRRGHAADGGGNGQRARAPACQPPDGELAFYFQPHHQEEDGEQPVVDPMAQAHGEAGRADGQAELLLPERLEIGAHPGIGDGNGDDGGEQQQHACGGAPAGEVEGCGADAMAQPAEHGIGERALVPRAVVAAPVDEERRRNEDAARMRAALVGIDALPGVRDEPGRGTGGRGHGDLEIGGDDVEVFLGERFRARHQLDVRVPEGFRIRRAFDQDGGAAREAVVAQRPMTKDIAQTVAELIADIGDVLVGRAAVRAGIAAVLDKGDGCAVGAENVVVGAHRPVKPVGSTGLAQSSPLSRWYGRARPRRSSI